MDNGVRDRRIRRRAPVVVALLTILIAAPVAADTDLGERGRTGSHLLVDTASSPGARCDYQVVAGGLKFAQMEVQAPVVYPAGSRLHQKVSLVVKLQRKRRTIGGWRTKNATKPIVERTTPSVPAAFKATWISWVSPADLDWRAMVEITWLDKGIETGFSRHRVDHYAIGASMKVQAGSCANLMPGTPAAAVGHASAESDEAGGEPAAVAAAPGGPPRD